MIAGFKALMLRARRAPGCLDFAFTADLVDSNRINIFELWQSEEDLNRWRAVAKAPKKNVPLLRVEMQKHIIERSGPPFARSRRARARNRALRLERPRRA